MQVLGSIVIDILVTLVIILFWTVLFALASPGPPDLFDKAKEALHACPPRAVPLIQAQTAALSQRVCEGVRSVSQRAQLRKISERERERARQRRRGREGGVRGEVADCSQLERMGQISVFSGAPVSFKKPVCRRVLSRTSEWVFVHTCMHM